MCSQQKKLFHHTTRVKLGGGYAKRHPLSDPTLERKDLDIQPTTMVELLKKLKMLCIELSRVLTSMIYSTHRIRQGLNSNICPSTKDLRHTNMMDIRVNPHATSEIWRNKSRKRLTSHRCHPGSKQAWGRQCDKDTPTLPKYLLFSQIFHGTNEFSSNWNLQDNKNNSW